MARWIQRTARFSSAAALRSGPQSIGVKPAASWRVELTPTTDLRAHRTFVTPPLDVPGLYVVVASGRADFREEGILFSLKALMSWILALGEACSSLRTLKTGQTVRHIPHLPQLLLFSCVIQISPD